MNLQSFDLNLLLAFESLMLEGSVTRAAKRINLSQPAMSNALARLRRTFDDPLLVRTPEGMKPTPVALSLVGPVRAALTQLRVALEEEPVFDPAASRRTFQILSNDYAETLLFAPLLAKLRSQAAGVTIRIDRQRSLFHPPAPASLAGSHDLAIGFFPDALSLEASIHSQFLWEEKNVCIARRAHPSIREKLSLRQYGSGEQSGRARSGRYNIGAARLYAARCGSRPTFCYRAIHSCSFRLDSHSPGTTRTQVGSRVKAASTAGSDFDSTVSPHDVVARAPRSGSGAHLAT